jgi:myo-inositol-1(or 4)-monophosphatase
LIMKAKAKRKPPSAKRKPPSRKPKQGDPSLKALEKAAIAAARAGGKVLLSYFEKSFEVREKLGAGLVTNADIESEAAIVKILKRACPGFGFLTEESPPKAGSEPGRWIIVPLDGTTNFVHGFPMFCVSIAAEWKGKLVVGVIHVPVLKETYVAVTGQGARVNGKRLRVSKRGRLTDSLLTTGFTYRKDEWLHREMEAFERLSRVARAIRRPGSAALDLAYLARGVFDGFWERRLNAWDIAAGVLLVREAGGKVTNFEGEELHVEHPELLATNGLLHDELFKAVTFPLT